MDITVILVSFKTVQLTKKEFETIQKSKGDFEMKMIILDTTPQDKSIAMLKDHFP